MLQSHSQISNRVVHTELKTYRPGSTRIDQVPLPSWHVSIPEDSGSYDTAKKTVIFNIFARLKPYRNPFLILFDPYRPGSKTLSKPMAWRTMEYTTRANAVLHCGSMRLGPGLYGYQNGIEIRVKILNMTKTFFSAASYSRNPSGIDTGYDPGLYGWNWVDAVLISYGPGSKSCCVWLHSRNAELIVNYFDPFRPIWTCI
jgi:hypothetical protein